MISIAFQNEGYTESDSFFLQLLGGLGNVEEDKETYANVPILADISEKVNNENILISPTTHFKQSAYSVPGWADTRFTFRKNFTIDATKVSGDLTNFPVLIDLYDSDLQNDAQASGNDIMFTNATGAILNHEIETYERVYNSTHAHLAVWVNSNVSGTQDTILSMYYGNPTAGKQENPEKVWDSNFKGIWHLSENPSDSDPQMKDSTSNNNDGTSQGGMDTTNQIESQIDGGLKFDNNNNINCGTDSSLDLVQEFSIEFWTNIQNETGASSWPPIISRGDGQEDKGWMLFQNEQSRKIDFVYRDTSEVSHWILNTGTALQLETWYHIVLTYSVSQDVAKLFIDGSQFDTDNNVNEILSSPLGLFFAEGDFIGSLDEIRISDIPRSSDWILTEYNNQYDPSTFYSIDTKENYADIPEWHYPGLNYIYRKKITIDSTKVSGSSLSNFPVLIDLEDIDLHDPHNVQPDGDDILFCDASGAKLDHEIEVFDQVGNGTHGHLVVWVRIQTLSGTNDTQIFMYFGNPAVSGQENPTSVWDENYISVWHLSEATGGSNAIKDSTANDNDGTDYNSPTFGQTGKISNAIEFDGTNQYIELPNSATLENITEGDYTYEAWFYADQVPPGTEPTANDKRYAAFIKNDPHGGIYYDHDKTFTIEHWLDGPTQTAAISATYDPQSYYHLVGVVSKTDGHTKLYVNGNLENTDTWTAGTDAHDYYTKTLKLGITNPGAAIYRWCLDGKLDEMRVSNTARSADWISTEYNNQNDTDTFYSVDSIEIQGNWTIPYLRYKKEITIDKAVVSGSNDLSNFPFLIDIYDADLHIIDNVQPDGDDIAFTDANGARLNHEIELFDQTGNGTHAHLIAWVEVPILKTTTDTKIYMWYGNSAVPSLANLDGVWNNYGAVWHLHDDFFDSTSNNNDGTNYQSDDVGAQIADGQDFDGVDDNINVGSGSSIDNIFNTGATISAWIYPEGWGGISPDYEYGRILDKASATWGENGWAMCIDGTEDHSPTTNHLLFYRDFSTSRGLWYTPHNSISLNEWQYVTVTFDDSSDSNVPLIYINGVLQSLTPDPVPSGTAVDDSGQSLYIGDFIGGGRTFDGVIDEVRLSTSIHSIDWIKTEFNNQFNPENLTSVGNEMERDWGDASFRYCKDIIINHSKVSSDLVNFPVLIDITDSDLKTGKVQSDASDILFIDPLGVKLDHEIESFTQTGSDGHLTAWVRVPYLYSTEITAITMYYGNSKLGDQANPEKVWDSNYKGTWHLSEDPSGVAPQMFDSTSNNYDGSVNGGMTSTDQINGQIDGSLDFDGIDDSINTTYAGISGSAARTISFWLNTASLSDRDIFNYGDYNENRFNIRIDESTTIGNWVIRLEMKDATTIREQRWSTHVADGNWHYIAVVIPQSVDISQTLCYVDGQQDTIDMTSGSGIADSGSGGSYNVGITRFLVKPVFFGSLDEVRISAINFPSEWITTEYNNQYDPTSFYMVAQEFSLDVTPPVINDFGAEDLGTGIGKFWADVTDSISSVKSVKIKINSTEYEMSYNGSYWIYLKSVNYGDSYEYQISNATDLRDNFITTPSNLKLSTFTEDTTTPNVDDWEYFPDEGQYGTFKANVSDSWGEIDTVIVNVTVGTILQGDPWALMVLNGTEYVNNTIEMNSGPIKFVVTVNDTAGNSFTSSEHQGYVPIINHYPVASDLTLSRSQTEVLLPIYSNSTLYLNYTFFDADSDDEGGTEIRWYLTGTLQSAYNNLKQVPSSALNKGDQWNVTVRPKDGQDFGALNSSSTITIQNTPPTITSAEITPTTPDTTSDLIIDYVYYDNDGDTENTPSRKVHWYKDDILQGFLNESTSLLAGNTTKGELWYYKIQVNDGTNSSITFTSSSVIITNSAPTASGLTISPSNPATSNDLTASWTFNDVDGDSEISSFIEWYQGVTHQPTYDGLTTLPAAATTKNQAWHFKLIVNDGTDNSSEYSSPSVNVVNTAPTASGLTVTSNPLTSDDLEASWTFDDVDGDSESTSWIIRWYKNNALQSGYNDEQTVPSSATSKGEDWNYTVKVHDGTNYSIQYNSSLTTILNSPPTASGLTITSNPTTSEDLTASWTFNDMDGDSENSNWIIHWYKDNVSQGGYTNLTMVSSSATSKGEEWNYTLQVFDGTDYSIQYNSSTTIIVNTPPTASSLIISPAIPATSNDLTASWTFNDVDGDSEMSSFIEWYQGVTHQPAYDQLTTLPAAATTKNQAWHFKLIVNDGTANSSVYSSPSVNVVNTAPTA
ncbi:MAG: DUF2341 domain-containing protein, partial [Candidatus Hodarchaeales archaeon]